jgi:hypothetical protein
VSLNFEQTLKYGDTGEPVRAVVRQDSNGEAPDWTGATVRFILYNIDPDTGEFTEIFDKAGDVELPTASSGALRYDWETGDTDRVGRFPGRFKVTDAGGVVESYPREGFMWFNIEEVPA